MPSPTRRWKSRTRNIPGGRWPCGRRRKCADAFARWRLKPGAVKANELGDALLLLMEGGYLTRRTFGKDSPLQTRGADRASSLEGVRAGNLMRRGRGVRGDGNLVGHHGRAWAATFGCMAPQRRAPMVAQQGHGGLHAMMPRANAARRIGSRSLRGHGGRGGPPSGMALMVANEARAQGAHPVGTPATLGDAGRRFPVIRARRCAR